MTEQELIKKMYGTFKNGSMADVLAIVKQNISAVAEVCPECGGGGTYMKPTCCDYEPSVCETCHGSGVVAKE